MTDPIVTFHDIEANCRDAGPPTRGRFQELCQVLFGADHRTERQWFHACADAARKQPTYPHRLLEDFPNTERALQNGPSPAMRNMARLHVACARLGRQHAPSGTLDRETTQGLAAEFHVAPGFVRLLVDELLNAAAASHPPTRPSQTVIVPLVTAAAGHGEISFGMPADGVAAELTVWAVENGTGACYPAPACSFVELAEGFADSVEHAAGCLKNERLWDGGVDVCWSLAPRHRTLPLRLVGGSAGLAFAIVIGRLLAVRRPPVRRPE